MENFRLPDYTVTTNQDEWIGAWHGISDPIEKALGLKLVGFDPGFLFRSEVHQHNVEIPVWLAERIRDALKGKFHDERPIIEERKKERAKWEKAREGWIIWKTSENTK